MLSQHIRHNAQVHDGKKLTKQQLAFGGGGGGVIALIN